MKAFVDVGRSADPGLRRAVTLDEGEAREKVDFALIRGGVITGKVLDDEGAPLIARRLQLYTLNDQGQKRYYEDFMYETSETDDRGVYRIYGLPPGRYIISAGGEGGFDPPRGGGGKFALTYHPDTTDEKQAKVIEIKEGSEVADVDIRFGSARKTYEAAGRVVDKETGKPVPRIYVSCGPKPEKDGSNSGYSTTAIADGQGNFKLPGLPPGRYQAMIMDVLGETGYTGEAAELEITNDNVSGVELKAFLGASVSGFVIIEGADAAASNRLQSIMIYPGVTPLSDATGDASEGSSMPQFITPARVNADGSFRISGLQPGNVFIDLKPAPDIPGLTIARIERNGRPVDDGFDVGAGQQVTGVRVVLAYSALAIRGEVKVVGGALPAGLRLFVSARRVDQFTLYLPKAEVDARGQFLIESAPPGEYEIGIFPDYNPYGKQLDPQTRHLISSVKERVVVAGPGAQQVVLVIDLSRKEGNQ